MHTPRHRARARDLAPAGAALALVLGACASQTEEPVPGPPQQEADVELATTDPRTAEFAGDLEELARDVPGALGVVLLDGQGREVAALDADRSFTSASLYKLFLAHAVLDRVDRGLVELDDPAPGAAITFRTALEEMIVRSDNASAAALGEWVGWREVEGLAHEHGFTATDFDPDNGAEGLVDMSTTPRDVAGFLHGLKSGELLSGSSTELLLSHLERQELDYALRSGFGPDVRFAHKTGLLEEVSHDAGIMDVDGREAVVAVLTDGWSGYEDSRSWYQEAGRAVEEVVRRAEG